MTKHNQLTARLFMKDGDELKPVLIIHPDKKVEYIMSSEERLKYEHCILNNVSKAISEYYRNKLYSEIGSDKTFK